MPSLTSGRSAAASRVMADRAVPSMMSKPTGACCDNKCSCGCGGNCNCGGKCCGRGHSMGKKIIAVLLAVLLVYLICLVGTLVRNNAKKYYFIGKADRMERTIMVSGYGKVTGTNDIAVTTIGFSNTDKDIAKAQTDNKKVMDQVMAELKKLGVVDKDMQTDYSIYPDYNYTQDKGQELKGYKVNNQVTVKIRDLSKITTILGLAGKYGATEVSGLNFTIDDTENLKMQAREKSLSDAKIKAAKLAADLGVKLGTVVSYNEYESSQDYYPMKYSTMAEGGGAVALAPESVAAGSKDVVMNTTITYEILP